MAELSLDILLPFYGDSSLAKETIRSVLEQSDPDWRLLIFDDGQPDLDFGKWVASLHDERLLYERNPVNLGANANYRKALGRATSDLVVMMGADDRMLPGYVQAARRAFRRHPDAAMYQPGVDIIDAAGDVHAPLGDRIKSLIRRALPHDALAGETLARSLLTGNWTYFPSICWRRDVMSQKSFRTGYHVVQDYALILDLVADGHQLVVDPEVTFEYRRHAESDSALKSVSGGRFAEEQALYAESRQRFAALGWGAAARRAALRPTSRLNAALYFPKSVRKGDWAVARQLARHATALR